jgi:hypothetical protein
MPNSDRFMKSHSSTPEASSQAGLKRWFGSGAFIALGILVAGRLAMEAGRTLPRFSEVEMEPHAAVEVYSLRKDPHPIETAIFGSSVTIWGVIPEVIAEEAGGDPAGVRKLAVRGGTGFDMWKLVENNQERFENLRLALIEIGPRLFDEDNETGRVAVTISQYASLQERLLLSERSARNEQLFDYLFASASARRSLDMAFLNVIEPEPGSPVLPDVDDAVSANRNWRFVGPHHFRPKITAEKAARILVYHWKESKLHDQSLRRLLAWLQQHHSKIILFQMPVHPDVAGHIRGNKDYVASYEDYSRYIASLGIAPEFIVRPFEIGDCGISEGGMKDHTHLNQLGATIYSHFLGKEIKRRLGTVHSDGARAN